MFNMDHFDEGFNPIPKSGCRTHENRRVGGQPVHRKTGTGKTSNTAFKPKHWIGLLRSTFFEQKRTCHGPNSDWADHIDGVLGLWCLASTDTWKQNQRMVCLKLHHRRPQTVGGFRKCFEVQGQTQQKPLRAWIVHCFQHKETRMGIQWVKREPRLRAGWDTI